jgi:methyl-accepting chemotaxis protein
MKSTMTVARQLALGFGCVLAMMCVLAIAAGWGLADANRNLRSMYEDRTVAIGQIADVIRYGQRDRILVLDALSRPTPENVQKRLKEIRINRDLAAAQWTAYMSTQLTPEEKALAERFPQAAQAYVDNGLLVAAARLQSGDFRGAQEIETQQVGPASPAFMQVLTQLSQLQIRVAAEEFTASQANYRHLKLLLASCVVLALATGIAAALLISRRLLRQLGAEPGVLASIAADIAKGDLGNDKLLSAVQGSVLAAMQSMRTSLVGIVRTVRAGVDSVATASAQIAHGNADLSARTEEQASSLQQTAASVEQLNGTVSSSLQSARQASEVATGATQAAQKGGDLVTRVVSTMESISSRSKRISDIIGVIDGIAFQTNILALNAAVEAARAGEQGRGFAVVAAEVRTLAQRSASAAKEIKSLIEAAAESVEQGNLLVGSTGAAMNDIVAGISRVNVLISEVTNAASEQSAGIGQISQAVSQIDQATQSNAALVEESAAAAESLRQQAGRLAQAVSTFVLPGNS